MDKRNGDGEVGRSNEGKNGTKICLQNFLIKFLKKF